MSLSEVEAKTIVESIAAKRRDEVRSALVQLRGSLEINLSVWGGPEHIPVELLQNADDAFDNGAVNERRGSITFQAHDEFLLVAHNGPAFTAEDVDYISSIGRPHKKPGRQSGWMDFGFKSVFQLTNSPSVFSGPFRLGFEYDRRIGNTESILIPFWVEEVPDEVKGPYSSGQTVFYLPYRLDLTELADFCHGIDFAPLSLAFLRHIRQITVKSKHGSKEYSVDPVQSGMQTVVESFNGEKRRHAFKLLSKKVSVPREVRRQDRVIRSGRGSIKKTVVTLALHLDENRNLVPKEGQLYYFVPTTMRTGLKFDMNGDFLLNAERTDIDRSLRWNEHLLKAAGELIIEAMDYFRRHRRWRYQFYDLLPSGDETTLDLVEKAIIKPVREFCLTNPIIISHENKWVLPSRAAIVPKRLQSVLQPSGLGLDGYLNTKVIGLKFIKSLQVADFTGDSEGELLEKFLKDNTPRLYLNGPKWFIKLYSYLGEALLKDDASLYMSHWWDWRERIRGLPIVLTENLKTVCPKEAVYPTRLQGIPKAVVSKLKFVHPDLVRARGVRKVLVDGFQTPVFSPSSAVESLLNEIKQGKCGIWSKKERVEVLRFVHKWLKGRHWEVPAGMSQLFPNVPVPTARGWVPAKDTYLHFEGLTNLIPEADIVEAPSLRGESGNEWENTFHALGVISFPRVDSLDGIFTRSSSDGLPPGVQGDWRQYWEWLGKQAINPYEYTDYQRLRGLQWVPWLGGLSTLQLEMRRQVLETILRGWSSYYENFVKTKYEWYFRRPNQCEVPSFFSWQLQHKEWLPTTHGVMLAGPNVFSPNRRIKSLIGDLAPYVDCSETVAKDARAFFENIGVKADLDVEGLVSILRYLASRNLPPEYWTEHRLACLKEAYRALAQQIDENNGSSLAGVLLLRNDKRFAAGLVWKDDQTIGSAFPDFDAYAWVPAIERPLLQRLFLAAGIQPLSKLVETSPVGDGDWDTGEWVDRFREKANFLYSLVIHHQPDVSGILLQFLNDNPKLTGYSRLRLKLVWNDYPCLAPIAAYFHRDGATLHLASSAIASDIAFALAKGLGLSEQTEQIERILGENESELTKRFERWGVAIVEIPKQTTLPDEEPPSPSPERPGPTSPEQPPRKEPQPISPVRDLTPHPIAPRPHIPYVVRNRETPDVGARNVAESEAMCVATWFEEKVRKRKVKDVSASESYDLQSMVPDGLGQVERYIEVKAHFSTWPVYLTDPEKELAQVHGDDYWLYVVTHAENGYSLYAVQNPAAQVDIQEHFTPVWQVVGWEEIEPIDVPKTAGVEKSEAS